jgi:TPR repeat protein
VPIHELYLHLTPGNVALALVPQQPADQLATSISEARTDHAGVVQFALIEIPNRAAAERGHGHAQMMLARYLAEGAAGEPHHAEARVWLERAAAQGVSEAQVDLAALPP